MKFNDVKDTFCGNKKAVTLVFLALCGIYNFDEVIKECKTLSSVLTVDSMVGSLFFKQRHFLEGYDIQTPAYCLSVKICEINDIKKAFEFHKLNGDLI